MFFFLFGVGVSLSLTDARFRGFDFVKPSDLLICSYLFQLIRVPSTKEGAFSSIDSCIVFFTSLNTLRFDASLSALLVFFSAIQFVVLLKLHLWQVVGSEFC